MLGAVLGLLTFAVSAWLWRTGLGRVADMTAEAALLAALVTMAAFATLGRPVRMGRARVPVGRVLPPAWWPRDTDTVPFLAAFAGAPVVVGAGAALLLFR